MLGGVCVNLTAVEGRRVQTGEVGIPILGTCREA